MHRGHEDIPLTLPAVREGSAPFSRANINEMLSQPRMYHRSCITSSSLSTKRKADSCLSRYGRYRRWKVKGSLADRLLIDWKHHAKRLPDSPIERGSCKLILHYFPFSHPQCTSSFALSINNSTDSFLAQILVFVFSYLLKFACTGIRLFVL